MKKKDALTKLRHSKETLRALQSSELREVVGEVEETEICIHSSQSWLVCCMNIGTA